MDSNLIKDHEEIGSIQLSIRDIIRKTQEKNEKYYFVWKNIYGGPADKDNCFSRKMNEIP